MLEDLLCELSHLKFGNFEEIEEWLIENFDTFIGVEWPIENQIAYLVCNNRLVIIFEKVNGKWRFNGIELTSYALSQEEG